MAKSKDDPLKGAVDLRVGERQARLHVTAPRGDVPIREVIPIARRIAATVIGWALED